MAYSTHTLYKIYLKLNNESSQIKQSEEELKTVEKSIRKLKKVLSQQKKKNKDKNKNKNQSNTSNSHNNGNDNTSNTNRNSNINNSNKNDSKNNNDNENEEDIDMGMESILRMNKNGSKMRLDVPAAQRFIAAGVDKESRDKIYKKFGNNMS